MSDLPTYMSTSKWSWQRVKRPGHCSDGFWIGSNQQGNRWLTKLRGSFAAYREILFGQLAQAMNWSCQSSIFIGLDATSAEVLGGQPGDIHAAHWFMEEHTSCPCGESCCLLPLVGQNKLSIEDIQSSDMRYLLAWPKSQLAAYIFGANEAPGSFFTTEHEFVIIDSEQMFSTGPQSFDADPWLERSNGSPSKSGKALANEVCKDISELPKNLIAKALAIPSQVHVDLSWPIEPKLHDGIKFATAYAHRHADV